jgi:hypothetical protein
MQTMELVRPQVAARPSCAAIMHAVSDRAKHALRSSASSTLPAITPPAGCFKRKRRSATPAPTLEEHRESFDVPTHAAFGDALRALCQVTAALHCRPAEE